MFTIDLMLKNNPVPLSVQRKAEEDAIALYQEIKSVLGSEPSQILELTCDRQPEKKVAIATSEIAAVQISQKSGATGTGRAPGFAALASE